MPKRFSIADPFTDVDAEKAIVAALADDPNLYWALSDTLPAAVFVSEETKQTYQTVSKAAENNEPISPVDWEPTQDAVATAKHLVNLYQLRLAAKAMEGSISQLHDSASAKTHLDAKDLINTLSEQLTKAQQVIQDYQAGQMQAVPDEFPSLLDEIQQRYIAVKETGSAAVGLRTGIKKLDSLLGGLQKGIHMIAAEPSAGKTSLTLQIAGHVAENGNPVIFVSFEEPRDRLALKAISQKANLDHKSFWEGYGNPNILLTAMHEHGHKLVNLHILMGTRTTTVQQIKAKALQLMHRTNTKRCLIIVDYLQTWASVVDPNTLSDDGSRKVMGDFRFIVSALAAELRNLANSLDSPVIVISSQNRQKQGEASMTSFKESGEIEYGADSAWILVNMSEKRPVASPARAVDCVLVKNRYGDRGKIELIFRPQIGSFHEVAVGV